MKKSLIYIIVSGEMMGVTDRAYIHAAFSSQEKAEEWNKNAEIEGAVIVSLEIDACRDANFRII